MAPSIICFINQKGGCGKSSSCFQLSGYYAQRGLRVLLVDADPQGSLSQGFFGSVPVENLPPGKTLAAIFDDEFFVGDASSLHVETPQAGIFLVPANQTLAPHNTPSPENSGLKQFTLRMLLDEVDGFDLVLIDCPPNLYQCSWNAMLASDRVVIPVPPEDFGTQGLRVVHQAIDHARQLNPRLELLGHLVTRSDRRLLVHRSYEQKLRELYRDTVLTCVIPEAVAFKVALACRTPVSRSSPGSRAARDIAVLGAEILERLGEQPAQRGVL